MNYRNTITRQELEALANNVTPSIIDKDGADTVIYHPDFEGDESVWIYVNADGLITSFGIGDSQTKFDNNGQSHHDKIKWVYELIDSATNY